MIIQKSEVDYITFKLKKMAAVHHLTGRVLAELTSGYFDKKLEEIILTWRGEYLSVPGNKDFKYPTDWWQAVKERFAPKLYLKYWPIKYTVISTEVIFPKQKLIELDKLSERQRLGLGIIKYRCEKLDYLLCEDADEN